MRFDSSFLDEIRARLPVSQALSPRSFRVPKIALAQGRPAVEAE